MSQNDCLAAYDVIGGNESKTVILDAQNDQQSTLYCLFCLFINIGVFSPEDLKFSGDYRAWIITSVKTCVRDNKVRDNYVR